MLFGTTKVYAFVGPSGTGKSYRAQMVANEYGIKHFEVSAKTGYNINEGFDSLINDMIEKENIESNKNNIKLNNKAHKNEKNKKCIK